LTLYQIDIRINYLIGGRIMAKKKFTDEEIRILKESPYVLSVTPDIVQFSVEFKEQFWFLMMTGKTPTEVILELGIDPNILGKNRIDGLKYTLRRDMSSGKGFRDKNSYTAYNNANMSPEVKIRYLEQQLTYKNQEIEFLKKIVSLGEEAVELW